jgi:hypothetical protein
VFLIGTALDFRTPNEFSPAELDLIKSQFNVITPENSMKPGPVHPQENTWNWTQPEALVAFCQDNNIRTVGHCLAWHSQTNPCSFRSHRDGAGAAKITSIPLSDTSKARCPDGRRECHQRYGWRTDTENLRLAVAWDCRAGF